LKTSTLVISADSWNRLSEERQKIVRDLVVENGRYASALTIDLALQEMRHFGLSLFLPHLLM